MGFLDKLLGRGKKPEADTMDTPERQPEMMAPEPAGETEGQAQPGAQQPPEAGQQGN